MSTPASVQKPYELEVSSAMFGLFHKKKSITEIASHTPWCVDTVAVHDNVLEIRGWAVNGPEHPDVSFTINGKEFDEIVYPTARKKIGELFWFIENSERCGFACKATLSGDEDVLKLNFVDKSTLSPLNSRHEYYFKRVFDEQVPFPPAVNRGRVHGSENEGAFRIEGYSTFVKLNTALKTYTHKDFETASNILDWGCGCGRVSRYFPTISHGAYHGIDIDEGNVQWCRENLKFGEFQAVPLHPPTDLPSAKFDVLFGISVFTHLKEQDQMAWLDELARISADGAILLMTTHGRTTAGRTGISDEEYSTWHANGFWDIGVNNHLLNAIPDDTYYRNVFHTHKYIRKNWTKHFSVLEFVEGYIGNHQDLVILRRKPR